MDLSTLHFPKKKGAGLLKRSSVSQTLDQTAEKKTKTSSACTNSKPPPLFNGVNFCISSRSWLLWGSMQRTGHVSSKSMQDGLSRLETAAYGGIHAEKD